MTNRDLTSAKVGDTVVTVAGARMVVTCVYQGIRGLTFSFDGYCDQAAYVFPEIGRVSNLQKPNFMDIAEIIPATPKLSGEIWHVVFITAEPPMYAEFSVTMEPTKEEALATAQDYKSCSYRVLAITNKTTWTEGDGLHLLEGSGLE